MHCISISGGFLQAKQNDASNSVYLKQLQKFGWKHEMGL
jgi:hypothetical protein